jgi:pimeloyl-ACP methyl ester carboxylesterase
VETNAKYADYSAVFVEGVGHFLHLENPEVVNRHIRGFLAEIERQ